jgi:hypothetical protein
MPEGMFVLTEDTLRDLTQRQAVTSTVEEALRSRVRVAAP